MQNIIQPLAPEWRRMRLQAVVDATGLGKSTVWQWVREGKFPKPYKLASKVTVWDASAVQAWLEAKAAERNQ